MSYQYYSGDEWILSHQFFRQFNNIIIHLQLIIFMALAAGHSSIRCGPLTMHTQTAIHVAEKIMKVQYKSHIKQAQGLTSVQTPSLSFDGQILSCSLINFRTLQVNQSFLSID